MEHHFTRQELYDRVWSKPISHLVTELGTTTGILSALLRCADIPTPSSGHWMRKQFGKHVEQPPLPPMPPGCVEPLVLDTEKQGIKRKPKQVEADPAAAFVAAQKAPTSLVENPAEVAPKPRPTHPTTITREELYGTVWTTPMSRLAEGYGISGNGLAKICDREDIPYPPRGYWAKHAVGKAPKQAPLPKSSSTHSITIRPTPLPPPPIDLPPEIKQQADKARASESALAVPERLLRPHAVIASWLAEHEEKKRRARSERDPWMRDLYRPSEFTETDRRKHRILDALFKAIERQGGKVKQGERGVLFAEVLGEKVEFQVREKQKQERRPLTDDEKRWRSPGGNDWKKELVPTGRLVFEIKTWQWPSGLARQWLESEKQPMEGMLSDILATFVAAGPLLVQQHKDREAAERDRQLAEQRRYEEQRRRKRDANRWRRFRELAEDWHELAAVRDFLMAMRSMDTTSAAEIDGRSVEEWIAWAEEWLQRADPTAGGVDGVFKQVAAVTDWTYRD
ncbi:MULTISPECIES: hypothetical protein [unclassified Ensifer]|uniref:hypothetical protein n=1 Tax=unclassified Ensifer TaxID=2633371 RepID=UPI00300FE56A